MSRIYEALRQADLEKNIEPGAMLDTPVEPAQVLEFIRETSPDLPGLSLNDVARHPWSPSADAIPCLLERGLVVERFRSLRSRLFEARQESAIRTVLISSGMPSEGKSFVALNSAVSLARGAGRVLLIDGDLRCPTLHESLAAPRQPGLSEYLAGTAGLPEILQQNSIPDSLPREISNLTFMPAGTPVDTSSELLNGGRMKELITSLASTFDWIIIDSPPVLAVTDAIDLGRVTDAVLLVAREACTPYKVMQQAQAAFKQSRLLGIVLNASKSTQRKNSYYYSSYYGSHYGESGSGNRDRSGEKTRSKR